MKKQDSAHSTAYHDNGSLYAMTNAELLEEIDRIMEQDAERMDVARLGTCLEILQERAPVLEDHDSEQEWEKFVSSHPLVTAVDETEDAAPQAKRRISSLAKRAVLLVAVIGVLFGAMVTAQATGMDVFGALARWTEETFHFTSSGSSSSNFSPATDGDAVTNPGYDEMNAALDGFGMESSLVPSWMPDGYEVYGDLYVYEDDDLWSVDLTLVNDDNTITCTVEYWYQADGFTNTVFQKNSDPVECYTANGKTFYFLSNGINGMNESQAAIWSDGNLICAITGNGLTRSELRQIVDSIGD